MMQHIGTQTIQTPRLNLRAFRPDDAQAMYENWAGDPEVSKFLTWPAHQSAADSRAVLEGWAAAYARADFYEWAIVPKENADAPVGSISVVRCEKNLASAEVGYCIGRAWWNRGVTSEALMAVLAYLFERAGFNRVAARHDPDNPYSGMVMRRCGMRCEGTMRQADRNNQGLRDCVHYGLLRADWEAQRAARAAAGGSASADTVHSDDFRPGRYRHFKGGEYELLGMAAHSETREPMVVYRALYGECGLWVRPASLWNETLARGGRRVKRFAFVGKTEGGFFTDAALCGPLQTAMEQAQATEPGPHSPAEPDASGAHKPGGPRAEAEARGKGRG